ncbi:MAG: ATP-binding cassette domain-containing protein, partial [Gammaproteobacteria bacterium]|nr:ATP-binding cassette domain-containing protein [Gammaproteobacteria bacterium]
MLQVEQVSLSLRKTTLLETLSFEVTSGELIAVLGPNGAGKSSLLQVLCGLKMPSIGEVRLFGRPLHEWPSRERAQKCALLSQDYGGNFGGSVAALVALGRYPYSETCVEQRAAIQDALAYVDALHLKNRDISSLSSGELQRVHMARVLCQLNLPQSKRPALLLLDEHVAHLDMAHQHQSFSALQQLVQQGMSVICALHDVNLALRYAH